MGIIGHHTAPPIERLVSWVADRWHRSGQLFEPPAAVAPCGWCTADVNPGAGHWDYARRTILCSDECWEQHADAWAL
jgi:hypothetical protein